MLLAKRLLHSYSTGGGGGVPCTPELASMWFAEGELYGTDSPIAIDDCGNITATAVGTGYIAETDTYYDTAIKAKILSTGQILWQREDVNATPVNSVTYNTTAVAGDGTGYGVGKFESANLIIGKDTSSGTRLWRNGYAATEGDPFAINSTTDASGNLYVIGVFGVLASQYSYVMKLDPAGTILWQKKLVSLYGTGNRVDGVSTDADGNCYVVGSYNFGVDIYSTAPFIAKFNAAGVFQWVKILSSTLNRAFYDVAVSPAGVMYVAGGKAWTNALTPLEGTLTKYDASGGLIWQRQFPDAETIYGVAVDADENAYAVGTTTTGTYGVYKLFLVKFSPLGILLWQREITYSADVIPTFGLTKIKLGKNGHVIVGSQVYDNIGPAKSMYASLKTDGTGLGTYGPFTYAESTLTVDTTVQTSENADATVENTSFAPVSITTNPIAAAYPYTLYP